MRLRRHKKRLALQFLAFGLASWCGPVLYLMTWPHSGNALGSIWWAFGALDGVLVWVLRRASSGKVLPQILKAYAAYVVVGSLTAGIVPILILNMIVGLPVALGLAVLIPTGRSANSPSTANV